MNINKFMIVFMNLFVNYQILNVLYLNIFIDFLPIVVFIGQYDFIQSLTTNGHINNKTNSRHKFSLDDDS